MRVGTPLDRMPEPGYTLISAQHANYPRTGAWV